MNKKLYLISFYLAISCILLGVSKPPNYVTQANEGKLFSEEELAEDFKLKFKFEGGDKYMLQKLLTNPECLKGEVLNLLLGFDPYTGKIDKIVENPQEIEKVKNTFKKAIECAKEYLEKIQNEKSQELFKTPDDEKIKSDYDEFNEINEKLYSCSYKLLRCLACQEDCQRFGVVDISNNISKIGLENSRKCYSHCLSAITILPTQKPSKFCERCLDNFFVTDRELCDSECDYNPFNKCVTMAGEFQKCISGCKEKFDMNTELPDFDDCIQKCRENINKKYGKILTKKADRGLSICLNLPLVFEYLDSGKRTGLQVDIASLAGVCILPPAQAITTPGFQPSPPCIFTPIAQPPQQPSNPTQNTQQQQQPSNPTQNTQQQQQPSNPTQNSQQQQQPPPPPNS